MSTKKGIRKFLIYLSALLIFLLFAAMVVCPVSVVGYAV